MDTPVLPTYVCYAVGVAAFGSVPTIGLHVGTAGNKAVVPAHGVTPLVKT